MRRDELATALFRAAYLRGTFQLRSSAVADEYFDKYQFESDPYLLREVGWALSSLVPRGAEVLAGLELGGVPLATILSQITGIPAVFVRKVPKTYGTCRLAEGGQISGRTLVLIEDVVTSGGQLLESARELRSQGAAISDALCVIDRESGGPTKLAAEGIAVHSLFTMSELKETGRVSAI